MPSKRRETRIHTGVKRSLSCLARTTDVSYFFGGSLGSGTVLNTSLTVVPHVPHTSAFLDKLNVGPDGRKESVAYDCGHELTEEGIERSTEWIRVYGLLGAERKEERRAGL